MRQARVRNVPVLRGRAASAAACSMDTDPTDSEPEAAARARRQRRIGRVRPGGVPERVRRREPVREARVCSLPVLRDRAAYVPKAGPRAASRVVVCAASAASRAVGSDATGRTTRAQLASDSRLRLRMGVDSRLGQFRRLQSVGIATRLSGAAPSPRAQPAIVSLLHVEAAVLRPGVVGEHRRRRAAAPPPRAHVGTKPAGATIAVSSFSNGHANALAQPASGPPLRRGVVVDPCLGQFRRLRSAGLAARSPPPRASRHALGSQPAIAPAVCAARLAARLADGSGGAVSAPLLPERAERWRGGLRHPRVQVLPVLPRIPPAAGRSPAIRRRGRRAHARCRGPGLASNRGGRRGGLRWLHRSDPRFLTCLRVRTRS